VSGKSFRIPSRMLRERNATAMIYGSRNRMCRVLLRMTAVVLFFSVAGLTTGAKNSVYYPHTNGVHFLSCSSKAKVAPAPVLDHQFSLQRIENNIEPQPAETTTRESPCETPPAQRVCITIALQHRSPPLSLA